MKRVVYIIVACLLAVIAFANVAAATGSYSYQPEVPEKLRK